MGRGTKTTEFLKECMSDALIKLIGEKKNEKISIEEIVSTAGVSRSTWFRNFSSKNEALTFKLVVQWNRWANAHNIVEPRQYTLSNSRDFFKFNYSIKETLKIIYAADFQTCVYDAFYQIMMPKQSSDAFDRYRSRFYSYGLFGLLDEWIKQDFKETPEEMIGAFEKMIHGFTQN